MNRQGLFDCIRSFAPNRTLSQEQVDLIDALADGFRLSREMGPGETIDPTAFAAWAPNAVPGARAALQASAARHGIAGRALAAFLGQYHHESAGFSQMTESLNYSVEGLLKTFGRHRISEADARKFGRAPGQAANQNALANILYGGDWGARNLGNTQPGDGWKYRARGFGGTTGRSNYAEAGYADNPDALLDPVVSADVSARYFVSRGCVPLALAGDDEGVTRRINGGTNGLTDRVLRTQQAKGLLR